MLKVALGLEDIRTLRPVYCLGMALYEQDMLAESEATFIQALADYQKFSGPYHMIALNVLRSLGSLHLIEMKYLEALDFATRHLQNMNGL